MYVGVIYTPITCHVKNGEVMANGSIKLQGFYILGEAQELASILQSEQRMTNVQIPTPSTSDPLSGWEEEARLERV